MVTDFVYDGIRLSDLGYAIVSFDGARDDEVDTDSQLSFNHVSFFRGKKQPFITSVYEEPLEFELYIAKNLCGYSQDMKASNYNISVRDMAFLKRWLSRTTPHKLTAVNDEYNGIYWNGSFNIEEYVLGDGRIGAHLTFECDAPYGYKEEVTIRGSLNADESYEYNCMSDEIGWIYPTIKIDIQQDGDLNITNAADNRTVEIKGCVTGETITIDNNMQIRTNVQSHKIADDFNYVFYRVINSFDSVENSIQSNIPIDFTIKYTPYAKAVMI